MYPLILGLSAVGILFAYATAARAQDGLRRRRFRAEALAAMTQDTLRDGQIATLQDITRSNPKNAAASYLLGVMQLRDGHVREAARSFGTAYHRDWRLETAALLTFACLKAQEGPETDIVDQIIATWNELGRPRLEDFVEDWLLIEWLNLHQTSMPDLSALGRLVWSLCDTEQQQKVASLLKEDAGSALRAV